jgi:hypothetical protein
VAGYESVFFYSARVTWPFRKGFKFSRENISKRGSRPEEHVELTCITAKRFCSLAEKGDDIGN